MLILYGLLIRVIMKPKAVGISKGRKPTTSGMTRDCLLLILMEADMTVQDISTLISGVGFPIVCSLLMFWQNNKLNESHREETNELRKTIESNTLAIQTLIDKIDTGEL